MIKGALPFHMTVLLLVFLPAMGFAEDKFEFLGFDEATLSPEALEGLREVFGDRSEFSTGMPLGLVNAMAEEEAKRDLGYDPTSVLGKFYGSGALPSPPSRGVDESIALGQTTFNRDGATLSSGNCFACHAGVVKGKVVAGLGNNSVMQRPPRPEGTKSPNMMALVSALKTDAERAAVQKMMSKPRGSNGPSLQLPPMTNRGDNYGPFGVWAKGTRLTDPKNLGLVTGDGPPELAALIEENMVPPVNPMPWWLMKYKTRDYWYGDGAPDDAAHFSFNFSGTGTVANDQHIAHVESTAKVLAFARETKSPIYPGTLNADLVQKGANLFHGRTKPADMTAFETCSECHGIYKKKSDFTDFSKPGHWIVNYTGSEELKSVRTDREYNKIVQKFSPINKHISKLVDYYAAREMIELGTVYDPLEGKGYLPPPLDGVWATAPYFHNGSIPTISAVLNSEERPEIWAREPSPHAYDLDRIGLDFTELSREEYEDRIEATSTAAYKTEESLSQMFIFDTEGFGRAKKGHTFGDSLTTDERAAIMEFLKSLSGPDMTGRPNPMKQAKL
jgi:hypothetical protein